MIGIDIFLNCFINFIWGMAFTFSGYAMLFFTPILVYALRFFFGGIIGIIINRPKKISKSDWLWITLIGIFRFLEFIALAIGMVYLDSSTSSIIGRLVAPLTMVFSAIVFREKIRVKSMVGIAISLTAIYIISNGIDISNIKYLLITLLYPIFYAFTNVLAKKATVDSGTKTAVSSFISGVLMFIYVFIFNDVLILKHIDYKAVLSIIYLAVVCGYLNYVGMYYLLSKYDSSKVMPYAFLTPISSMIGGFLLLGEPITVQKIGGMALILLGIIITQWNGEREKIKENHVK
jgi:O-acetylserine/cysteine efflux transporter